MVDSLKVKLGDTDFLFFSTNLRILETVAEELTETVRYDEYLTRESKWNIARNISSLLTQSEFFNYSPHRKIGSNGTIRVSSDSAFDGDYPVTITIPKYTEFTNGETSFASSSQRILSPGQNFIDIQVVQGVPKIQTFEITSAQFPTGTEYAVLEVNNDSIEESLYDVKVNGQLWTRIEHIRLAESATSQNFVLRNKNDFSGIQIEFGNDVFGKKLEIGDIVTLEYLETKGENGNILESGNVNQILGLFTDANDQVVTLYASNISTIIGGTEYEEAESIRVNAPRSYQTGDRAMTRLDYQTLIIRSGAVDRVIVWGETEVNEDRGNPPGTYLPLEENLVYISGFNINPITLSGTTLTVAGQTFLRDELNPLKGPTDIIRFVDTQFIYITFHCTIFVSDKRYSLEEARANVENGLRTNYSLENTAFRENLYFSQYYEYINSIEGVGHHRTNLSFTNLLSFNSAYAFDLDLALNNIKPNSVKISVRTQSSDPWTLIAQDDGNFNLIGEQIDPSDSGSGFYNLPGATINYADGFGGEILVTFGLNDNYTLYQIRVDFELEDSTEGDLLLTQRQQIYSYYQSNITMIAV